MDYVEQIKGKMKKSGGIITSKEIKDANIPTMYLTRMVENGEIIRVDRGIYILPDGDYDEYYFLQKRSKVAIFSYLSALYLHQFSDLIPEKMEITVYKGYNVHRLKGNVKVHYVTRSLHHLGVTECETAFGNKVKTYDLERTICDLVKNRQEIEAELFAKTINKYVRDENKDLHKLYDYSKKMNIYEKVKEIIEIVDE